jgi:hypothetical protein
MCHDSFRPHSVLLIDVAFVFLLGAAEEIVEDWGVAETLDNAIHKAGVA